jgi:hypothetical protein
LGFLSINFFFHHPCQIGLQRDHQSFRPREAAPIGISCPPSSLLLKLPVFAYLLTVHSVTMGMLFMLLSLLSFG